MQNHDKRCVYCDNAATTRVSERVLQEMLPYFLDDYGNPSSIYRLGRNARKAVENARERIADKVNCQPSEIVFTSGGTESDNFAIMAGAKLKSTQDKRHIITDCIEHHAVLNTCRQLEKQDFEVTYLPVDRDGFVSPEQVRNAIRSDTALVSVMLANNEIGTIQPVREIAEICRAADVLFHTDAVAAMGSMNVDAKALGADMISVSGHKLHAPKGTGFLYIREGINLPPFINGGGQEKGYRSGTENVPYILGLAKAVEDIYTDTDMRLRHVKAIRDIVLYGIMDGLDGVSINGSMENRLCGNINLSFEGTQSESLILLLDMKGISVSGGSACSGNHGEPSHVLSALGLSEKKASEALRFTFDNSITVEDAEYVINTVIDTVKALRALGRR